MSSTAKNKTKEKGTIYMTLREMFDTVNITTDNLFVVAGYNDSYDWYEEGKYWDVRGWGKFKKCDAMPEIPEVIMGAMVHEFHVLFASQFGLDPTAVIFVHHPKGYDEDKYWTDDNVNC